MESESAPLKTYAFLPYESDGFITEDRGQRILYYSKEKLKFYFEFLFALFACILCSCMCIYYQIMLGIGKQFQVFYHFCLPNILPHSKTCGCFPNTNNCIKLFYFPVLHENKHF